MTLSDVSGSPANAGWALEPVLTGLGRKDFRSHQAKSFFQLPLGLLARQCLFLLIGLIGYLLQRFDALMRMLPGQSAVLELLGQVHQNLTLLHDGVI